jgi:glycosyltransferase involved in cell wall biosynthesis
MTFITPTLRKGLSIFIIEAMAVARPIVATSILSNTELIEHEVTGLLVDPRFPEQIAEAIARFVSDPILVQICAQAPHHPAETNEYS